jgi:hypothetical protein
MTTAAPAPQARSLSTATTSLGWIAVALWTAVAGLVPLVDRANWQLAGSIGNLGAAVMIAAGLLTYDRVSPWVGFSLISLGALLGGVLLVHLLAPMLLSTALIVAAARDTFSQQMV